MALPSVFSVGSKADGTGNITVTLPSHAANDILVLIAETSGGVGISAPSGGWAHVTNSPVIRTTSVTLGVMWLRATSGAMTNPTITAPGDHCSAYAIVIRGCPTTGTPFELGVASTSSSQGTTLTLTGGSTTEYNELVMAFYAGQDGDDAAEFSAQTNSDLASIAEQGDVSTSQGDNGCIGAFSGSKVTPGSVGNSTITMRQTGHWAGLVVGFLPAPEAMTSYVGTITPPASADIVRYKGLAARPRAGMVGWGSRTSQGNAVNFHQGFGIFGDSDLSMQASVWNRVDDGYTGTETRRIHREGKIIEQRGITGGSAIRFQAQVLATHADGITIQWNVVTDQPIVIYEFWPVDEATVIRIESPDRDVAAAPVETTYSSVLSFTPYALISITLAEQYPPEAGGTAIDGTDDSDKVQVGYGFAVGSGSTQQGAIGTSVDSGAGPVTNHRAQLGKFVSSGDDSVGSAATIEGELTQLDSTLKINWTTLANSVRPVWILAMRGGTFRVLSDTEAGTNTTKATTGLGFTPEQLLFLWNHRTSSGADAVRANLGVGVMNATNQAALDSDFDEATPDVGDNGLRTDAGIYYLLAGTPTSVGRGSRSSLDADGLTLSWADTDGTARFWMGMAFTTTVVSNSNAPRSVYQHLVGGLR